MSDVNRLVQIIRSYVDRADREIGEFVSRLEQVDDHSFSPDCLAMVRLENDEKTLRKLADRIGAQRLRLSKRHLVAAE